MQHRYHLPAVALLGAAAVLAPLPGRACSPVPLDAVKIKQIMAKEIGYRLGLGPRQLPLEAISAPELHTPFGLDALCHGLNAFHYSAGFRHAETWRLGPGPFVPPSALPPPAPSGSGAGPGSVRDWPPYAQCNYEGVAVLLGFDGSSPVAVHFQRNCS